MPSLKNEYHQVSIRSIKGDFVADPLPGEAHGILIANALHYVKERAALLAKIIASVNGVTIFLVVEYDLLNPIQPWVPYPLGVAALTEEFARAGFGHVRKLYERPSRFNRAQLYSVVITRFPNPELS